VSHCGSAAGPPGARRSGVVKTTCPWWRSCAGPPPRPGTDGIRTVAQLAASDPDHLPVTIGQPSRVRLQAQAALQVRERQTRTPHYELLAPEPGRGLLRLPPPSEGTSTWTSKATPTPKVVRAASTWPASGPKRVLHEILAHSSDKERVLTTDLLADLTDRLDDDPAMHVYHYAPYERSALERLTQRHGVAESEFDRLLRASAGRPLRRRPPRFADQQG